MRVGWVGTWHGDVAEEGCWNGWAYSRERRRLTSEGGSGMSGWHPVICCALKGGLMRVVSAWSRRATM